MPLSREVEAVPVRGLLRERHNVPLEVLAHPGDWDRNGRAGWVRAGLTQHQRPAHRIRIELLVDHQESGPARFLPPRPRCIEGGAGAAKNV